MLRLRLCVEVFVKQLILFRAAGTRTKHYEENIVLCGDHSAQKSIISDTDLQNINRVLCLTHYRRGSDCWLTDICKQTPLTIAYAE